MKGPIIIGGNGGSGTRAVAEVLIRSGVHLGQDLNTANLDDQLFVFLFRRARLLSLGDLSLDPRRQPLFALHEKLFMGRRPGLGDLGRMLAATRDHFLDRQRWSWILRRWARIAKARPLAAERWGWKEPNSHLFLAGLKKHYQEARYVLVLRDGLDMAFSRNYQQLKRWGAHFGLDPGDASPRNRFEYWYRSNRRAIAVGTDQLGDAFLTLRLEDLCTRPQALERLLALAGSSTENIPQDVRSCPRLPASVGRHRRFDTSWIDSEVERKAAELGYVREDAALLTSP